MSQDKKFPTETKLTEEEKLFEQKKAANPYIVGFIESMAKSNTEKIDPGDRVMQFSENRPSSQVTLKIRREDTFRTCLL
jgi:hypothetical protein